eukprot:2026489-Rhodomonas_salina.1
MLRPRAPAPARPALPASSAAASRVVHARRRHPRPASSLAQSGPRALQPLAAPQYRVKLRTERERERERECNEPTPQTWRVLYLSSVSMRRSWSASNCSSDAALLSRSILTSSTACSLNHSASQAPAQGSGCRVQGSGHVLTR